jgi:hypothetical protein
MELDDRLDQLGVRKVSASTPSSPSTAAVNRAAIWLETV